MKEKKRILSILIKILVGISSFGIIYLRLSNDLTADRITMIAGTATSFWGIAIFVICVMLIPVNWGIESYKWQLITEPVERVSYATATRSVYSGVCLGNLAPGRATEFLAKIIYFDIDNRPQVSVLHFINGLFQLSVTIIIGFGALGSHINKLTGTADWMIYTTGAVGLLVISGLMLAIRRIDFLLNSLSRKISRNVKAEKFHYRFSSSLLIRLFLFSLLRYLVFFIQFALLLFAFHPSGLSAPVLSGIALYFLVTSTLPMISVFEAAIRAAVAIVVFYDSGVSDAVLALTSVLVWLINIIIPSAAGYYFLLRQNFNFKLFRSKT